MVLAQNVYDLRNIVQDQGIIFSYSGYITESVLFGIGEALKQKLYLEEADKTTMRNIFAIFVEQMQNVIRYSAELELPKEDVIAGERDLRYGVLNIGKENDKFYVTCGNKIIPSDVDRLNIRLVALQKMSTEDLKALYKQKLRDPTEETSKGAGVGFIEIARRSSEIINFGFLELDDKHSFFVLKAYV